jgi:hypothetical protein
VFVIQSSGFLSVTPRGTQLSVFFQVYFFFFVVLGLEHRAYTLGQLQQPPHLFFCGTGV